MTSFDFNDLKQALVATVAAGGDKKLDRFYDIKVHVTGKSVVDPGYHVWQFKQIDLGEQLRSNIRALGFERPLPIQQFAIPYIKKGLDVIGHSITGSGKTAAYVLPILDMLQKKEDRQSTDHYSSYTVHPRALILVPTRELAIQIAAEFKRFSAGLQINAKLLYGGEFTTKEQMMDLRTNTCDILVATLGRLKNCIERGYVSMANVKYFVLDEADKMLDLHDFGPDIKSVVESGMPTKDVRQTLLFSATFPAEVQELVKNYMEDDFVFVSVGNVNAANSDITQEVIKTTFSEKFDLLLETLREQPDISKMKILIFVATIPEANVLMTRLVAEKFSCNIIHREIPQLSREHALNEFKEGKKPILVATSVAARGLDIVNLDLVINYSLPPNIREYVQRIGRTGRIGNKGRAIAFFDSQTDHHLGDGLVKVLTEASMTNTDQKVPRWLLEATGRGEGPVFLDD